MRSGGKGFAGNETWPSKILRVASHRGGQVTYHGPGQVVVYPLIDLRRLGIYVKEYVFRIEAAVIQALESHGVIGFRVAGAPGIYVYLADPFQPYKVGSGDFFSQTIHNDLRAGHIFS